MTVTERKQLTEAWMDNKHKFEHQIFHIGAPNLRDSQELVRIFIIQTEQPIIF